MAYKEYVELFPMSAQSILLIKKIFILRINIVFQTLSLYALCFCLYALCFTFFDVSGLCRLMQGHGKGLGVRVRG